MRGPSTQIAIALWAIARLSTTHQLYPMLREKTPSYKCYIPIKSAAEQCDMSKNVPAAVVACAAVVAVVGPGFCRGATCLVRSSMPLVVASAKYLQGGLNN